jgi:hypothetical protein
MKRSHRKRDVLVNISFNRHIFAVAKRKTVVVRPPTKKRLAASDCADTVLAESLLPQAARNKDPGKRAPACRGLFVSQIIDLMKSRCRRTVHWRERED